MVLPSPPPAADAAVAHYLFDRLFDFVLAVRDVSYLYLLISLHMIMLFHHVAFVY